MFYQSLIKRFSNTYKFSNYDIHKFISLLQKVFTHMNTWVIGKNSPKHILILPEEDITDADYTHAKRVCKDFEMKNLGKIIIRMLKMIHCC